MTACKEAEQYIAHYFKAHRGIPLYQAQAGRDLQDAGSTLFVEVKASTKSLAKMAFRYFTNAEYQKAAECAGNGTCFEIHIVAGIGTSRLERLCIPGEVPLERAMEETHWFFPIRKDFDRYRVHNDGRIYGS